MLVITALMLAQESHFLTYGIASHRYCTSESLAHACNTIGKAFLPSFWLRIMVAVPGIIQRLHFIVGIIKAASCHCSLSFSRKPQRLPQ